MSPNEIINIIVAVTMLATRSPRLPLGYLARSEYCDAERVLNRMKATLLLMTGAVLHSSVFAGQL